MTGCGAFLQARQVYFRALIAAVMVSLQRVTFFPSPKLHRLYGKVFRSIDILDAA